MLVTVRRAVIGVLALAAWRSTAAQSVPRAQIAARIDSIAMATLRN